MQIVRKKIINTFKSKEDFFTMKVFLILCSPSRDSGLISYHRIKGDANTLVQDSFLKNLRLE